jgi:hypothetical protein
VSELHTVWEPEQTPEATAGMPGTLVVKAWGPFRDGRFLVNVGHAEYTPNQALVLAAVIARAALEAGAAQARYDAEQARPLRGKAAADRFIQQMKDAGEWPGKPGPAGYEGVPAEPLLGGSDDG